MEIWTQLAEAMLYLARAVDDLAWCRTVGMSYLTNPVGQPGGKSHVRTYL